VSNQRELTEIFHLLFLQRLNKFVDKRLYALKGGCNLRFYLRSIRYSEDIDLDVHNTSVQTLKKNIDKLLDEQSFRHLLQAQKLSISSINPSKQTDTTQRWKIVLVSDELQREFNTKVEFSRRNNVQDGTEFGAVEGLTSKYKLKPVLARHYSGEKGLHQKIEALAGRTQTQTRDVFDIKHLLDAGFLTPTSDGIAEQVEDKVHSLTYQDYCGQVIAYLEPEYQEFYQTESIWGSMVDSVLSFVRTGDAN